MKKFQNKVLEAIYKRRSIRKYKNKKVSKKIVNELLNAGVMAPSAMNRQPWKFSVVRDREVIDKLAKIACDKCIKKGIDKKYNIEFSPKMIFYNAPLLIVISGEKNYEWLKDDVNLCVENMFLAAYSLGLGSCWIGFAKGLNESKEARKILGIQSNDKIVAPLIFGFPLKEKDKIPKRNPEVVKWVD